MNVKQIPIEWFACPETKEPLKTVGEKLISSKREFTQDQQNHFWNFVPSELKIFDAEKWETWNVLQDNATIPYSQFPESNLGVGERADFLQFAEFCKFRGNVLDVGVGPQALPTHIKYNKNSNVFFVGIDPLRGQQPRGFAYVQGLGEYLPFKNETFDQVLFVTSLDHFIDPTVALLEAKRVLKKDGDICVWLGEKDKNAPRPKDSPEWYKKLEIPSGADDPFHFKRFSIDEFKNYAFHAGLSINEELILVVDEWRRNCFYRLIV